MSPKSSKSKKPAEQVVKDIRRRTRRHFSAEDKIRFVLEGLNSLPVRRHCGTPGLYNGVRQTR